jgi:hypothetical protein
MDTDLVIAGIGLGLVIGPLTSATLRVVPSVQHGIASAGVVVSRMIGMLIGISALGAWGLYKFNQHLASLPKPTGTNLREIGTALLANTRQAYVMQYGDIFTITAIVCVVGALLGLLIAGRHEHADEQPAELSDEPLGSDPATTVIDSQRITVPDAGVTERFPTPGADDTQQIPRQPPTPGRHRQS